MTLDTTTYLAAIRRIEGLHKTLGLMIESNLRRMGRPAVTSVQALLLFNMGDSELTAGELRSRGHYPGTNVSYTLKKLVSLGYIYQQRSETDRRSVRVRLTEEGREIADIVGQLFESHTSKMTRESLPGLEPLLQLENFWVNQTRAIESGLDAYPVLLRDDHQGA
jgi:DNA-binding MarR family transcriptional regulator